MTGLVLVCGWIATAVLTLLAVLFWFDPEKGLRQTTHDIEQLPRVMADRYAAFAVLALTFTAYGDLTVLAILFAVFAFMGFADGIIYARTGRPHWKHTASGIASLVVAALALAAG